MLERDSLQQLRDDRDKDLGLRVAADDGDHLESADLSKLANVGFQSTSSPSISRPGWKRTTILLVKTLVGDCTVPQPLRGSWIFAVASPFPLTC